MADISHKTAAHESAFGLEIAQIQEAVPQERIGQTLQLLAEQDASEKREHGINRQTFRGSQEEQIIALYDEYRPRLFRYLRSLRMGPSHAEEVIQETFMRLAIELRKKGGMENVQGWIVRVAHNLAMKTHKNSMRDFVASSDAMFALNNYADSRLNPEESCLEEERIRRMETALSSFSTLHRQCFNMRVQGFRYKDIAMALRVSEQRVAFVVKQVTMRLAAICG